jgi:hypothetical protein
MHIDTSKLKGEYPPEPECQVNSKECSFKPIHALCHDCGRKLCEDCAVGVRHQPRMFKYTHRDGTTEDRVELHCQECANSHSYNLQVIGAGAGGVAIGLLLLFTVGASPLPVLFLALAALGVGGYLLYNEYTLKQELEVSDIGSGS